MRTIFLISLLLAAACGGESAAPPVARAPTHLDVTGGADQVGQVHEQLAATITVRTTDAKDAVLPQQLVGFVVVKGGGQVFTPAVLTNDAGEASNQWTLGDTAGEQILEARAIDDQGNPIVLAEIHAQALPGPLATSGWLIDSLRVAADTVMVLPAFARDVYGNAVPLPKIIQADGPGELKDSVWSATALGLGHFVIGQDTLRLWSDLPAGHLEGVFHLNGVTYYESADLVHCSKAVYPDCYPDAPYFDAINHQSWRSDSAAGYVGARLHYFHGDFFGIYPGNPAQIGPDWPGGPFTIGMVVDLTYSDHVSRTWIFANPNDTVTVSH